MARTLGTHDPVVGVGPARPLRVLLVDDHELARTAAKLRLRRGPGLDVVGEARSGDEALSESDRVVPDVVVVNAASTSWDGTEVTRAVLARHPGTRAVVVTDTGGRDAVVACLASGAAGYVARTDGPTELARVVRLVGEGGSTLHPAASAWVEQMRAAEAGPSAPVSLVSSR